MSSAADGRPPWTVGNPGKGLVFCDGDRIDSVHSWVTELEGPHHNQVRDELDMEGPLREIALVIDPDGLVKVSPTGEPLPSRLADALRDHHPDLRLDNDRLWTFG